MSDEAHVATVAAPSAVSAGAAVSERLPAIVPVLERLMSMADHCLNHHLLRQAAAMYFEMLDRPSAGVPETEHARRCLLEIAEHYEETGNPHQARGIYERLL
jgi:hypothetical protein